MVQSYDTATLRKYTMAFVKDHFGMLLLLSLLTFAPAIFAVLLMGAGWLSGALVLPLTVIDALLIVGITFPILTMGLQRSCIDMIDGKRVGAGGVFSRLGEAGKALSASLRMTVWGLPGLLITIHGIFYIASAALYGSMGGYYWYSSSERYSLLSRKGHSPLFMQGYGYFLLVIGIVAMVALITLVSIRYSMAMPLMAEHPEMSTRDAFRKSKEIMKGRAGSYFMLVGLFNLLVFVLNTVLITIVVAVGGNLGAILAIPLFALCLVANIFACAMLQPATVIFYIGNTAGFKTPLAAPPQPAYNAWQNPQWQNPGQPAWPNQNGQPAWPDNNQNAWGNQPAQNPSQNGWPNNGAANNQASGSHTDSYNPGNWQ